MRPSVLLLASFLAAASASAQEDDVDLSLSVGGVEAGARVQTGEGSVQLDLGGGGVPRAGVQLQVRQRGRPAPAPAPGPAVTASARGRATVVVVPAPPRDCGTGEDPGCTMLRQGHSAMDAETYRGFLAALRANANELSRQEICETMLSAHWLTAAQLGPVLDLFVNEITRLEVAQTAAPRLVNPSHALGFAAKWHNGISAQEYTELMASQR